MAFVHVRDLLEEAKKQNTSVIAFDALDYNTICSCIRGAEIARRPVIIMLYPGMREIISFRSFAAIVKDLAQKASVPVALHLDHCTNYELLMQAIEDGFTSVMADGSTLSYEDNVRFTRSVVQAAREKGVDVEGELGHVGQVAAGDVYTDERGFTLPEEAASFAEETGVTSLAVAIGSCHGMYKAEPKLALDRLQEIRRATGVPLVLHGGSGIPEDQLEKAFRMGINKFNVATEYVILYEQLQHTFYTEQYGKVSPFEKFKVVRSGLEEYIARKLQLCTMKV